MKQQDWIDYFEAVNGRSPEPADIAAAIAKGEFEVEPTPAAQPVSAEPVTPTVDTTATQQPVEQTQASPQAPLQFQQVQGAQGQSVYNVQVAVPSEVTVFWKQFWEWLVSAWKRPTSDVFTHPYNGWAVLGLVALFSSLIAYIPIWKTAQAFSDQGNGLLSGISSYFGGNYSDRPISNPYGFGAFLQIFIGNLVIYLSTVLAGFLGRNIVYQEKTFTFQKSLNYFGRLYSINLLLAALSSVLLLVDAYTIAGLLIFVNGLVFVAVNIYAIASAPDNGKVDGFYKYLIASIVSVIVISIAMTIGLKLGMSELMRGLPFDSLNDLF